MPRYFMKPVKGWQYVRVRGSGIVIAQGFAPPAGTWVYVYDGDVVYTGPSEIPFNMFTDRGGVARFASAIVFDLGDGGEAVILTRYYGSVGSVACPSCSADYDLEAVDDIEEFLKRIGPPRISGTVIVGVTFEKRYGVKLIDAYWLACAGVDPRRERIDVNKAREKCLSQYPPPSWAQQAQAARRPQPAAAPPAARSGAVQVAQRAVAAGTAQQPSRARVIAALIIVASALAAIMIYLRRSGRL